MKYRNIAVSISDEEHEVLAREAQAVGVRPEELASYVIARWASRKRAERAHEAEDAARRDGLAQSTGDGAATGRTHGHGHAFGRGPIVPGKTCR